MIPGSNLKWVWMHEQINSKLILLKKIIMFVVDDLIIKQKRIILTYLFALGYILKLIEPHMYIY